MIIKLKFPMIFALVVTYGFSKFAEMFTTEMCLQILYYEGLLLKFWNVSRAMYENQLCIIGLSNSHQKEVTAHTSITQCGNLRIFLLLGFYVKSIMTLYRNSCIRIANTLISRKIVVLENFSNFHTVVADFCRKLLK